VATSRKLSFMRRSFSSVRAALGVAFALAFSAACDVEPANVLRSTDEEQPADDGATATTDAGDTDAGCACIPGVKANCLELSGPSATACAGMVGTRRCEPDGSWGPCTPGVTIDDLAAPQSRCSMVHITGCGYGSEMNMTVGDCSHTLGCAPAADPLE
jgi:hypothetical protein